ncbi:hypothetical protein J6590_015305 [Homalodisca vitripennis]|nr:hypothetical protein J6590_015305 [Homalodisca vitripennis]
MYDRICSSGKLQITSTAAPGVPYCLQRLKPQSGDVYTGQINHVIVAGSVTRTQADAGATGVPYCLQRLKPQSVVPTCASNEPHRHRKEMFTPDKSIT